MSDIDWSKAPHDATHAMVDGVVTWIKDLKDDSYCHSGSGLDWSVCAVRLSQYAKACLVERPIPPQPLNVPCVTLPIPQAQQTETHYRMSRDESAIATLERLGYRYKGGELWKPPIGKTPDHIEYDGWGVGDECWISNELGYGILDDHGDLVGFDKLSRVVAFFATPKGIKMAVVAHANGDNVCWRLSMLKRPLPKCDFEHGKNVFISSINTCVGRYVGTNPDTNDVVTVYDGKFRSYQLNQVTQQ